MRIGTNRFKNLDAAYNESHYNMDAPDISSLDESAPDISTLDENQSFNNLIETSILITENDHAVFESLINRDFERAFCESINESADVEIITENESKKAQIADNIKTTFTATRESVLQTARKTNSNAESLIKSDKDMLKKYTNAIKKNGLANFPGISKFAFPDKEIDVATDSVADATELVKAYNGFVSSVLKSNMKSDIESAFAAFNDAMKNCAAHCKSNVQKATAKKENWVPSSSDIAVMMAFTNGSAVKKSISQTTKNTLKAITTLSKKMEEVYRATSRATKDELDTYKMNMVRKASSLACKELSKKFKAYNDLEVRQIAAYRRALITCGKFALRKSAVNEATMMLLTSIGESSDAFVFEYFER